MPSSLSPHVTTPMRRRRSGARSAIDEHFGRPASRRSLSIRTIFHALFLKSPIVRTPLDLDLAIMNTLSRYPYSTNAQARVYIIVYSIGSLRGTAKGRSLDSRASEWMGLLYRAIGMLCAWRGSGEEEEVKEPNRKGRRGGLDKQLRACSILREGAVVVLGTALAVLMNSSCDSGVGLEWVVGETPLGWGFGVWGPREGQRGPVWDRNAAYWSLVSLGVY